jgi:hypothetical protein
MKERKRDRERKKDIHMITENQGDKKIKSGSGKKKERRKGRMKERKEEDRMEGKRQKW